MVKSLAVMASALVGLAAAAPNVAKRAVPVGQIITSCTVPGTVALTFDDGPYIYTNELLTTLAAAGHRATFFQNGQNWDNIYNYNATLQAQDRAGHLLCSHTWSHADLTQLSYAGMQSEMSQMEVAFQNIIGKIPTCMRPPYLAYNDTTLADLGKLNYKVFSIDIDTLDWEYDPQGPSIPISNYENGYNAGYRLSLNHDVYQVTVEQVVPAILTFLAGNKMTSVTVAECLGEDPASWYVQSTVLTPAKVVVSSSSSTSSSTKTSTSSTSTKTSSTSTTTTASSTSTKTTSSTSVSSSTSTKTTSSTSTTTTATSTKTTSSSSVSSSTSTKTSSSASTVPSGVVSPNDTCGPANSNYVCGAGKCCSAYGYCGTTAAYCQMGCQSAFGTCTAATAGSPSGSVDPNGTCGGTTGFVCASGMCCSQYGWCGTGTSYC